MKTAFASRLACAMICATSALAACAQAADAGLRTQIQRRADALAADWAGHNAHAIAKKYFTADVSSIGEGGTALVQGRAQLEQTLRTLFKQAGTARLEVRLAKPLGPDAAYAWVVWHCNDDQAPQARFQVRSLYVYRREGGRWKIAADAYSMGGMPR